MTPAEYAMLQEQVAQALSDLQDTNAIYTNGAPSVPVFDKVYRRPVPVDLADPSFGLGTSELIGQDSGDVFALLTVGYNFDGTQNPVVIRQGDPMPVGAPILSMPNFYGAHGYDPTLSEMSAIFYAAGPDIRSGRLPRVRNIDVAPTVARLLGVELGPTADGHALPVRIGRKVKHEHVAGLTALLPTGDRHDDKAIKKAIDHLGDSLAHRFWSDDATLSSRGEGVFDEDREAVQALAHAGATASGLRKAIVDLDEELAAAAVDRALGGHADPKLLARAQEALADGRAASAAGDLERAVSRYRKAWESARRALGLKS